MKKLTYLLFAILAVSCMKDEEMFIDAPIDSQLEILEMEGLKFQSSDITDGSLWNFKTLTEGQYTLEIRNHFKTLISKNKFNAEIGDNVSKFYTKALLDGDYTIVILSGQDVIHERKLTIR